MLEWKTARNGLVMPLGIDVALLSPVEKGLRISA
jgi:hypothetical protein